MLRAIRRFFPREPKYPAITASSAASCRCRLTFHDRSEALRNRGSTVTGARPMRRVVVIASLTEIAPAAVSGIADGGLPAVSRTTVVLGWSTADPKAARTTVRPPDDGVQATPTRGSKFVLFCW